MMYNLPLWKMHASNKLENAYHHPSKLLTTPSAYLIEYLTNGFHIHSITSVLFSCHLLYCLLKCMSFHWQCYMYLTPFIFWPGGILSKDDSFGTLSWPQSCLWYNCFNSSISTVSPWKTKSLDYFIKKKIPLLFSTHPMIPCLEIFGSK